jgi:hypothetical protein
LCTLHPCYRSRIIEQTSKSRTEHVKCVEEIKAFKILVGENHMANLLWVLQGFTECKNEPLSSVRATYTLRIQVDLYFQDVVVKDSYTSHQIV